MSAKTEVPGVNNAVEKLQELEDRMRSNDFGFKGNDVDNIDRVIDALYELETERKKMHDELEKETIQSSILRHQLRYLPGQIRDEVMEAVMSARESNANVILELQDKLKTMTNNIITLDRRARELEQENGKLQPERELLKQQHEEIISQLNQRMAEKASLQIGLNETRDKVRQANQDIVDLEDGILQLKEDLIQERTEARQEKKRLKRAVTDTTQKTRDQKDQNVNKKVELDVANEKLMDSEGKLDAVRKSIRRYETSRAKLEGEERALAAQLAEQRKMNDQMRIRGTEIMNNRIQEERDFIGNQRDLQDTIKQYEQDILTEGARSKQLQKTKVKLLLDLREKEEIMEEDAERVGEMDEMLQVAKEALNVKAEEVGSMQTENVEMSEQIDGLAESHKFAVFITAGLDDDHSLDSRNSKSDFSLFDPANFDPAVLSQLNKQIEEYREQLTKEKKERLEVQAQKDSVSKDLDDLKTENQFFMTEMTSMVQDGKKQHQDLSTEGMSLQKTLKDDEEKIANMENTLSKAQRKYQNMFDDYTKRTDSMERQIRSMENLVERKRKELELLQHQLDKASKLREALLDPNRSPLDIDLLGLSIDEVEGVLGFNTQELMALRKELEKGKDFRQAFREVSLTEQEKSEVLALEAALERKRALQEEKTPVFQDLEVHFDQRNEEYDKLKKDIVAMKNRKQGLEEEIKRLKKDRDALKNPQEQMRKDLKMKRIQYMEQMQGQGKSNNDMEHQILAAGCKLRTVVEANHHFEESCRKLEAELKDLKVQTEENERIRKRLEKDLNTQKAELSKKWETDNMMQEFFASRDEATAEAFGRLLSRTEKRENKIDMITERLKEELSYLAGFLDNISTRRPQESKEEQEEGSISPGKALEAVAAANQERGASRGSPDTAFTLKGTVSGYGSSPSPRSAHHLAARSHRSSRQGTAQSRLSTNSTLPTPRSALKSPRTPGSHSPVKHTKFGNIAH